MLVQVDWNVNAGSIFVHHPVCCREISPGVAIY